ncbi:hypothetical protein RB653_009950 [Dictyostelium firmibasis]|uniref:Transmembrane protein 14 homolog n=1 Tax=Dictyostelium firmibasis TaxID=79012 RepID=A0AAN7TJE2_9MYCE
MSDQYSTDFKLNAAMAAIVLSGGVIGYTKSKSMPSLIAGGVFGLLYSTSAYYLSQGNAKVGLGFSIVASSLLGGVMGKKALATSKPIPIILTTGSVITFLSSGKELYNIHKN